MTRPLQVLLLESRPSDGAEAAAALAAAGHQVLRCHGPGDAAFPCAGLVDRAACPLRAGVDVAVDVRRDPAAELTASEDGVGCALRDGVPVVEVSSSDAPSSLGSWTIRSGSDVVASAESAAAAAFDGLAADIVATVEPLFAANAASVSSIGIRCEIERDGRRLVVHLVGPPVGRGLRQAASVRAYDAVRASGRAFDEVRLAYRPVVVPAPV